jgi:hypothetical protein
LLFNHVLLNIEKTSIIDKYSSDTDLLIFRIQKENNKNKEMFICPKKPENTNETVGHCVNNFNHSFCLTTSSSSGIHLKTLSILSLFLFED